MQTAEGIIRGLRNVAADRAIRARDNRLQRPCIPQRPRIPPPPVSPTLTRAEQGPTYVQVVEGQSGLGRVTNEVEKATCALVNDFGYVGDDVDSETEIVTAVY